MPLGPQIGRRGALDSPQQRSRRPHREAEGPAKPPRPLRRRLSAYPLTILTAKSEKKYKQGTSPRHFRGDFGAVDFNVFISFLLVMFVFCFFFFCFALSVSFIIIMRLRLRRRLRLELRFRLRLRLRLRLGVRLRRRKRLRLRLSQSLRT